MTEGEKGRAFVVHKTFLCVVFLADGAAGVGLIPACRQPTCFFGGL